MSKSLFIDLTGKKYNRLSVIKKTDKRDRKSIVWECLCDCGKNINISSRSLIHNHTKSCGCLKLELLKLRLTTHGLSKTPLYKVWCTMKARCQRTTSEKYPIYGGRGIKICDSWQSFENFYGDMSGGYKEGLSIDRINNDGNYELSNCKWSTPKEQANNRRTSKIIYFKGQSKTLAEWSDECGINQDTLWARINYGWSIERALTVNSKGGNHFGI